MGIHRVPPLLVSTTCPTRPAVVPPPTLTVPDEASTSTAFIFDKSMRRLPVAMRPVDWPWPPHLGVMGTSNAWLHLTTAASSSSLAG